MRKIEDIKKEILECASEMRPETWDRMRKCLDEIFLAYSLKARKLNIDNTLDDLGHYERHHVHVANIHEIVMSCKYIVDSETEEAAKYRLLQLLKNSFKEER